MAEAVKFFPLNTPLVNYFYYKQALPYNGPNFPLTGGFLNFFADEDHSLRIDTYSDVFDPHNLVVNPNPIQLGGAGDCPPIYMQDRLYFIVITGPDGDLQNPIVTIEHYDPAQSSGNTPSNLSNSVANGQFDYPIDFSPNNDIKGLISQPRTTIAWAWEFLQEAGDGVKNIVTFNFVGNENIEGDPTFEVQLESESVGVDETVKDFRSLLGNVSYLENQDVTLSFQTQSKISGTANIAINIEKNYGDGGSPTEIINVLNLEATADRTKFIGNFLMPANTGKTIGPNSALALRIAVSVGQICEVGFTNVLLQPGIIDNPIYSDEPLGITQAQMLAQSTDVVVGLDNNQSNLMYDDGEIFPYADSGTIVLCPVAKLQPFRLRCDGSSLMVTDYTNQIPNKRLFDAIGNIFGGSGDLIVTATDNKVTFMSDIGAREKSTYTIGTTAFTVVQLQKGLPYDISGVLTASNEVTLTWVEDFAPQQTPPVGLTPPFGPNPIPAGLVGCWFFDNTGAQLAHVVSSTITPGSGSTQASALLTFTAPNASDYRTGSTQIHGNPFTTFFLEFGTFTHNTRGGAYGFGQLPIVNQVIFFSVNGNYEDPRGLGVSATNQPTPVVPLTSTMDVRQIVQAFLKTINIPFSWQFTITGVPAAGQYCLYSSDAVDYDFWFKVDGVGSAPGLSGRTEIEVDISSTDSLAVIANKIAAATNSLTFSLPAAADLPTIPVASTNLIDWFINQ